MKIIVTGAAGFIGAHVVAELVAANHEVVGVDSWSEFHDPDLKTRRWSNVVPLGSVALHVFDVAHPDTIDQLVRRENPDAIIHLAAQAGVRYAARFPDQCVSANVLGTHRVLEAALRHDVERVVYASSSSVYGDVGGECREDDETIVPRSLYGVTKRAAELLAQAYGRSHGLRTVGARFFTSYGPWGRPDMAYFRMLLAAHRGTTFPLLANRDVRRDFTYVDDVARSVRALVEDAPTYRDPSLLVNVGGGAPRTLAELLDVVESVTARPVRCRTGPVTRGDVLSTVAGTSRQRELGLPVPTVGLREGIERTNAWFSAHVPAAAAWVAWTDRFEDATNGPAG